MKKTGHNKQRDCLVRWGYLPYWIQFLQLLSWARQRTVEMYLLCLAAQVPQNSASTFEFNIVNRLAVRLHAHACARPGAPTHAATRQTLNFSTSCKTPFWDTKHENGDGTKIQPYIKQSCAKFSLQEHIQCNSSLTQTPSIKIEVLERYKQNDWTCDKAEWTFSSMTMCVWLEGAVVVEVLLAKRATSTAPPQPTTTFTKSQWMLSRVRVNTPAPGT